MTKTFTLFFLLLGNLFFSIAKNNLHIVEINPVAFDNTAAKTSSATIAFRFENTDYLVIEPKFNSAAIFEEQRRYCKFLLGQWPLFNRNGCR
jgi:hypothetical protein